MWGIYRGWSTGYMARLLKTRPVTVLKYRRRLEEDPKLVERLRRERIPLTACPLSNVKLGVFDRVEDHNLKRLLDLGLCVTVNSDDPAYFGGYVTKNYLVTQAALSLTKADIEMLVRNAFEACFIGDERRRELVDELEAYLAAAD